MKRRGLVWAGAGAVAAVAGVLLQQRRESGQNALVPSAPTAGSGAGAAAASAAQIGAKSDTAASGASLSPAGTFWQAKFTQPNGQVLSLADWRGSPVVLNFWATWCPPCIKEMPEIDRFARGFAKQGGRVLGLAVDNPSAVTAYLARTPVSYAIGLAGFDGTELSRVLGNASGGLPFTVAFNRQGEIAERRLGETSFEELTRWAARLG
jgi:thiol-disulfide isomerase/thioredoxin